MLNKRGKIMVNRLSRIVAMNMAMILCLSFMVVKQVYAEGDGKKKQYFPQGTPTRAIQDLDDTLDSFITKKRGEALTADEQAKNRALKQRVIRGTLDVRELSRLSLAKHWTAIGASEQDRFVNLLLDILEEKALFAKEQSATKSKNGGKYFVSYKGHKFESGADERSFVKTRVNVPSENISIEINYRLKKDGGVWKIYDIIVDDSSLVDNYRYQFDSIIAKGGFQDLIQRMSKKLSEIKSQRK